MDKYFKVPMAAACAIANSSDDVDMLAGYAVLCRYAIPKEYRFTAAGAKAIRMATGISDFASKRVLSDLLEMRSGALGEKFLIERTGRMVKNAREHALGQWDGSVAYLPDVLTQGAPASLSRLIVADAAPDLRRDALLLLLHVYASVDYARWFGVDPDSFAYGEWTGNGTHPVDGIDLDLGFHGQAGGLNFWLMRRADDSIRLGKRNAAATLFGVGDVAITRLRSAFDLLLKLGMLCRVAIVETDSTIYPLWVSSPAYREGLRRNGITSDAGRQIYNAADRAGFDPDNWIIQAATSGDTGATGTGLFFVVTTSNNMPVVRTVFAPTFHAPTPMNMEGLREVNARTQHWISQMDDVRQLHHVA